MIRTYLEGNVILHLMNEMDHLRCQNVTVMQHPRELCKSQKMNVRHHWEIHLKPTQCSPSYISATYRSKKKKLLTLSRDPVKQEITFT